MKQADASGLTYFFLFIIALHFTTHSVENLTCLKLMSYSPTQIATKISLDSSAQCYMQQTYMIVFVAQPKGTFTKMHSFSACVH